LTDEALSEYRIALLLDPYSPDTSFSRAAITFFEQKPDEALPAIEKALDLDSTNQLARRLLGIIYIHQGQTALAVEALQEVLDEEPEDPLAHLQLGFAYRDGKDYPEAKKELETYLALVGETLEENSYPQIAYQINALDVGYDLSDEEGLDEFSDFYQAYFDRQPDVKIEEIDAARALVLNLPVSQAEMESQAYVDIMRYTAVVAALVVPRIDPPVDAGLLIRLTQGGKTLYTAAASRALLKMFGDIMVNPNPLFEALEIDQVEGAGKTGSFAKISQDVAAGRELELMEAIPVEAVAPDDVNASLQDSVDEQVRDSLQRDAALLTLLGVITPSLDLEQTWVDLYSEQVAGYYDPQEKAIFWVEEDGQTEFDPLVLAHEAAHALQDQHFDLEGLDDPEHNDDRSLAIDALIEGDAMLADVFYAQEHIPLLDQMESASQASGIESQELESAPLFISTLTTFPYYAGLDFVNAIYQRDG